MASSVPLQLRPSPQTNFRRSSLLEEKLEVYVTLYVEISLLYLTLYKMWLKVQLSLIFKKGSVVYVQEAEEGQGTV